MERIANVLGPFATMEGIDYLLEQLLDDIG
jgi:hypothetical protein